MCGADDCEDGFDLHVLVSCSFDATLMSNV